MHTLQYILPAPFPEVGPGSTSQALSLQPCQCANRLTPAASTPDNPAPDPATLLLLQLPPALRPRLRPDGMSENIPGQQAEQSTIVQHHHATREQCGVVLPLARCT